MRLSPTCPSGWHPLPPQELQQRDVHQLLGAEDLQDLLGMVTPTSLKISSQAQCLLQQTNEILEESGDVRKNLHHTFLPGTRPHPRKCFALVLLLWATRAAWRDKEKPILE